MHHSTCSRNKINRPLNALVKLSSCDSGMLTSIHTHHLPPRSFKSHSSIVHTAERLKNSCIASLSNQIYSSRDFKLSFKKRLTPPPKECLTRERQKQETWDGEREIFHTAHISRAQRELQEIRRRAAVKAPSF